MTFSRFAIPATLVLSILATGGCESDAGNGALIGGGVGALAGGVIGNNVGGGHHALGGALIGGAVGAGTGALIGHASDEHKKDERESYDRGYQDAQRNTRSSNDSYYQQQPRAGYTQYSESSRESVGTGGYSRSNERSYASGSYYGN